MGSMLTKKTGILAVGTALTMLTGCSAMLIGEGSAESPPIGSDSRETAQMAADDALADAVTGAIGADSMLRGYESGRVREKRCNHTWRYSQQL